MTDLELSWLYVVPWKNRQEFVQTYLDLYSGVAERQREAVKRITMWKTRVGHKLSLAIESSSHLTIGLLDYYEAKRNKELKFRNVSLRLQLAASVLRFVNNVVEKGQNAAYAQPVHELAKEMELPQFLVDIRHESSHRQLPSLPMLVRAAEEALKWLQKRFWSHQIKEKDDPKEKAARKRKRQTPLYNLAEMTKLLQSYQKASYKRLSGEEDSEAAREVSRVLRQIEHALDTQQRNGVLHLMVQPGHLIPETSQLKVYNIDVSETFKAWPPKVPDVLINIWRDLIALVHRKQLTALLAQHLLFNILRVDDDHLLENFMLSAWLRLVLLYENANYSKTADERASRAQLFPSSIMFDRSHLLCTCQEKDREKHFTSWTRPLERLVNDGSVSETRLAWIDKMYAIYRDPNYDFSDTAEPTKTVPKDSPFYSVYTEKLAKKEMFTVEDLKTLRPDMFQEEENDGDCLFKEIIDPIDWGMVPIGVNPEDAGFAGCVFEDSVPTSSESSSEEEESSSSQDEENTEMEVQEMADEEEKPSVSNLVLTEVDWS